MHYTFESNLFDTKNVNEEYVLPNHFELNTHNSIIILSNQVDGHCSLKALFGFTYLC